MRKRKKEEGPSLDSLLDTMTTVVGIMIVILIVVQLGADSAVKEYVEREKAENSEKLEKDAMKPYLDQKESLVQEKQKLQESMAAKKKQDQKLVGEIAALEKTLTEARSSMPESSKPTPVLQSEKKKTEDKKKTIEVKLKKIKGLLAKAPKPSSESLSKDVNLPDPKPAPPKAKPFRFLCRGGKIYPIDDNRLIGHVTQELKKAGLKPNKAKEYDGKKVLAHFSKAKPGDPFFQAIPRIDANKRIIFDLRKKGSAGEDETALTKGSSKYVAALNSITPRSHYLQFEVHADSFAAYLSARQIASKRNFPAGWKPVSRGPQTDSTLALWTVYDLGRAALIASKPPPPKPTGKPAPPKKPANVLD
jgi:hypothetical protein